jgi:hypothetical protein
MFRFIEQLIAATFNRLRGRRRGAWHEGRGSLDLGFRVADEQVTRGHVGLSNRERMRHLVVLGKTGSGKSFFLRYMCLQDIAADRGFLYFDLHGDATPYLLSVLNARERREHRHLSDRLIVIDPSDPIMSIGLNPLEHETPDFAQIEQVTEILRRHWGLDQFGARTHELMRNSFYVLAANGLTLVDLTRFLSDGEFRAACVRRIENAEIRQYFDLRYDQASEAMRAMMREPILNKVSAFTADPKYRHIVGQTHSSFSLREAMDKGWWVIVNIPKGRLGQQATTLGSVIFTMAKDAIFARRTNSLFTIYCDEIQNFVAQASEIETMLAEARKTSTALVSANQFLDQLPSEMKAALLSVGTHVFFQLSSSDADYVARALDGGRPLAERLKNLRQRHFIVKTGSLQPVEVRVPQVDAPQVDYIDLSNRVRYGRGRVRAHIERDIAKRQAAILAIPEEQPDGWE